MPVKILKGNFYNLKVGTPVSIGNILFTKIETETAKIEVKIVPKVKAVVIEDDPNQIDFTKMDFRVGIITKIWNHETADRLYCEEVDVGEDLPRQIASGLRQHYTLQEMLGKKVIVVCNLKESKLQGFVSSGMVLAAKTLQDFTLQNDPQNDPKNTEPTGAPVKSEKIILLSPPENSKVGDRVYIDGLQEGELGGGLPATAAKVKKNKIWESVSKDLMTDGNGNACWCGKSLLVSGGEGIQAVKIVEGVEVMRAVNSPIS